MQLTMVFFLQRSAPQGFSADLRVQRENLCLKIVRISQQRGKRCLPATGPVKDVVPWKQEEVIRIGFGNC